MYVQDNEGTPPPPHPKILPFWPEKPEKKDTWGGVVGEYEDKFVEICKR